MKWYDKESICDDLPTVPKPELGIILVTGATGYIGGRLVFELLSRGYKIRVMVRSLSPEHQERWPGAEIVEGDALNPDDLRTALEGVSVAFYLIHSMLLGKSEFEIIDLQAATNFRRIAEEKKIRRIIYLGGLGKVEQNLSVHLQSRTNVAEILSQSDIPVTILRAAIIIGSGSASYEILEHMVRNVPVFFIPYWAKTLCQPISIRDVIKYLVGVLESDETVGNSYDIGGEDVLSYEEMMKIFVRLLRRTRIFMKSPVSNIKFCSYAISLMVPVPAQIISCLMESVKNEVVCEENNIKKILPFQTVRFKVALLRALSREDHDIIYTRWSDSYPPAYELAIKLHELETPPHFISSYYIDTDKPSSSLFKSVCQIGGKEGWFHTNWMWRLRGMFDRLVMGVGTSRGRRSFSSLRINDVIDFWRVEDLKRDRKLLLRAEMKLPGKAWLEFRISEKAESNQLSVHAYFQPNGILGNLYWYNFLPFHYIIFKDLLKQLVKRS